MKDNLSEPKLSIDASSQNALLKKKLEDLNSRYTNLQNNHETEILRLENSIQSLHRTHNEQLGVLNSTIKSLQKTLDKVRNENTELMNSLCSTANSSKAFSPISSPHNSVSDLIAPSNDTYLKLKTTELENKRLLEERDSLIEITNILQEQIKSMPDYKDLLKKSQNEVKKLQKKISQLSKTVNTENKNEEQKILMNQNNDLKKKCTEKDKKIADLMSLVSNLKLELSEVKSELSQKESQIFQLKCNVPIIDNSISQKDENSNFVSSQAKENQDNSFNKKIEIYEGIIQKQNQQILEFTEQRNSLMNELKKLKEMESKTSSDIEKLKRQNEELIAKWNEINEESEAKFYDILKKFSDNYDISFDSSKTPYQNIVDLIESGIISLMAQNQTQYQNDENNENDTQAPQQNISIRNLKIYSEDDMEQERKKKEILLKQLENAINFIHSLANSSNSTGAPQFDFRDRTLILTQCARMGQFIEDEDGDYHENLSSIASLFDPLSVEANSKLFFHFIDQHEDTINDSPIHELYVMFLATLEVNFLLFNKINEIQSIRQSNQQIQEQQKRAQQQNSLKQLLDEQNAKIRDAKTLIEPYVQKNQNETITENDKNDSFDDFLLMLQIFVESHEELIQENEKNGSDTRPDKSNYSYATSSYVYSNTESTSTSQLEQRLREKNVSFKSSMIPNMDSNSMKAHLQKAKTKNTKLQQTIEQLMKEKSEIEEKSKKKLAETENLLKKSKKENKNLLDQNQKLKAQFNENEDEKEVLSNKLKELSGSYQRLKKEKNELEATMEKKYDQIKENDKKIKEKNNSLSKRISELEQMNNQALSELKERTTEMVDKYDNRVEKLDQELKDTRDRLIEALSEIKNLKNDKMVSQMTIKKMKIEEKNDKSIIEQLSSQVKSREEQITAKYKYDIFQNKTQYIKKVSELKDAMRSAKQNLADLLYKKFKIKYPIEEDSNVSNSLNENECNIEDIGINSEKDAFDKILCIFAALINEKAVAELAQLNLGKNSSIIDLFQDMEKEIDTNKLIIQQMETLSKESKKEVKRLTHQNKKLENVQKDLNNWVLWARSLYRQITEGLAAPGSNADLRCALEESLMASIGHRKMQRKLEILRAEKKAFTIDPIKKILQKMNENNGWNIISSLNPSNPVNPKSGVQKVYSIRPVVLMLMCARRLQVYSGCLTSAYKCGKDENSNLSFFTESS